MAMVSVKHYPEDGCFGQSIDSFRDESVDM